LVWFPHPVACHPVTLEIDRIHGSARPASLLHSEKSLTIELTIVQELQVMCSGKSNQCYLHESQELQALQKRFMSQVSHELRTPLTKILSSAELIELSYQKWSDEKKLKYLGVIQKAALELMELLNQNDFQENLKDFTEQNFQNRP
jgi:signal transduction histidine kinase